MEKFGMSGDRITFACNDCGVPVGVEGGNLPNDNEILKCQGCGRAFGTYTEVRTAMIEAGKRIVNEMIGKADLPAWITRKHD
jgi:hypothetical protein